METKKHLTAQKYFQMGLLLLSWFSVVLQVVISPLSIITTFSYFTVLSNILVAFVLTFMTFIPSNGASSYLANFKVQSATALYIFIVGLIYNLVLRGIWKPQGWHLVADTLLHVVVPALYFTYWLIFTPKGILRWTDGVSWAYFPLVYLIYSLIRGHFVGWYPIHF